MWRVTFKGILAHKLRFVLTGVAVVLGVAFMSGTLVLTDTTIKTFDELFANVLRRHRRRRAGTDGVSPSAVAGAGAEGASASRRRGLLPTVRAVDGVRAATATSRATRRWSTRRPAR